MSIALVVEGECAECSVIEKELVCAVILFRLYTPEFPKNIDSIIQQKNQFHGFEAPQYCFNSETYEIAKKLLELRHEFMIISQGEKSNLVHLEPITYFWRNNQKKPKFVKKIVYKKQYHNFFF